MNRSLLNMFIIGCAVWAIPVTADSPGDALQEQSRDLTGRFAAALKTELQAALEDGGPAGAIDVCRDRAPRIAGELARESGARIGRTSLKFRNPQNAPAAWQRPVLEQFDALEPDQVKSRGEWFEFRPADNIKARYMKAIPTQPLCTSCHGSPEGPVKRRLQQSYPHDRATGYEVGEVRGAFYIEWPEPAHNPGGR